MTKTKKSAKKRPKNDNNKHGKKEQPDKEEANQNEKPMTKEDTTILYRGFSHIKGLVAYLCLMIFKSPYTIIICIWTSFCAFCGRLSKILSFRFRDSQEKITALQKEKGDVKTRCQKEKVEERLRKEIRVNKPVVRDLTEPIRPMRIEIQFSELFENEWTNAYTEIDDSKFKEIETIKILLKILSEIYEICSANVTQQLSGHRSSVHGVSDDETEGYIKAVKNSLKINASKYIPILCKKITSDSSSCKTVVQYRDCCLAYIENCVNLCYYAAVQDPPMVIDFVPGKIFDKQSWKEYSRSGTEVEYVVWPALYLYKGGPIMTKGVVQPKENTP